MRKKFPVFAKYKKSPDKKKFKKDWKALFVGGFFILCLVGAVYEVFSRGVFLRAKLEKKAEKAESSVVEKKASAIWCQIARPQDISPIGTTTAFSEADLWPESNNCYYIDKEGIIFREAPEVYGTVLSTFYGNYDELKLGKKVMEPSLFEFTGLLKDEARNEGLEFIKFLDESVNSELKAMVSDRWVVYFDLARPAVGQVKVLGTLLRDFIKDNRVNLWYVDLRIAGRAFYKLKPANSSVLEK